MSQVQNVTKKVQYLLTKAGYKYKKGSQGSGCLRRSKMNEDGIT